MRQHLLNISILPIALLLAACIGLVVGFGQWIGIAVLIVGVLAIVVFVRPELAFIASIVTIAIGQFVRIPISGGENAVIINDILLPGLIIVWALRRLASRRWTIPRSSIDLPIIVFVVIMLFSLALNRGVYTNQEFLTGALYAVRWIEYLIVLWMGYEFVRTQKRASRYLQLLVWIAVGVSVLGFLQLRIYPDFSFMVPQGWDPHVGRLLSTWFDPNFLAGFLALITTIALAVALEKPFIQAKWWWVAIMIMVLAIVLTFSRSGYVALALGAGFVTLIRARWIFIAGLIGFVAIVLFVPRVQERVVGIRTIDETAQLRLVSWNNARLVIEDHPIIGVGYNLYRYVQVEYGFLDNAQEHSASGSDSSFLSVWVTTGVLGLLAYVWLFFAMLREAWCTWRDKHLTPIWRGFGLGLFGGLLGLFLHSQFVNSLLYPHIMQTVWLLLAIAIMVRQEERA